MSSICAAPDTQMTKPGLRRRHEDSSAAPLGGSSSFSMPRAIGRSKLGPSLRTSAGARLMVILFPYRQRNELLEMAEVTRSLLSFTAVSGNPTTAILSVFPHPAWTSISTSNASTPTTAAEYTFDGITEQNVVLT